MRLHSRGLSLRGTVAVFKWLGVDCSHGAVWNWTHTLSEEQADSPTAEPLRVAVNETRIQVDGEEKWLSTAIDTESKLLLEIDVFSRRGTDPRRRSSIGSLRPTRSQIPTFSSTGVGI